MINFAHNRVIGLVIKSHAYCVLFSVIQQI